MKLRANICGWQLLFITLSMCALIGLVLGCSASSKKEKSGEEARNEWVQDMREGIIDSIEDPGTKNNMLAVVDQIGKDHSELAAITRSLYVDFIKLDDKYDATPEDYENIISEFEERYQVVVSRIIEKRFKIRDMATPEEWEDLTKFYFHEEVMKKIRELSPET